MYILYILFKCKVRVFFIALVSKLESSGRRINLFRMFLVVFDVKISLDFCKKQKTKQKNKKTVEQFISKPFLAMGQGCGPNTHF